MTFSFEVCKFQVWTSERNHFDPLSLCAKQLIELSDLEQLVVNKWHHSAYITTIKLIVSIVGWRRQCGIQGRILDHLAPIWTQMATDKMRNVSQLKFQAYMDVKRQGLNHFLATKQRTVCKSGVVTSTGGDTFVQWRGGTSLGRWQVRGGDMNGEGRWVQTKDLVEPEPWCAPILLRVFWKAPKWSWMRMYKSHFSWN